LSSADLAQVWRAALSRAAKSAAATAGRDWVAVVDGPYFVALTSRLSSRAEPEGGRRVRCAVAAKPVDADPLLWQVLGPEDMGTSAKQLALRVSGAFALEPVPLERSELVLAGDGSDADRIAQKAVSELVLAATRLRQERPDLASFLDLIDAEERAGAWETPRHSLLATLTALLAGDPVTAARMIDEARARGERQFSTAQGTVWELLDRDRRTGTGVFAPTA
jgi:hypothetical protein